MQVFIKAGKTPEQRDSELVARERDDRTGAVRFGACLWVSTGGGGGGERWARMDSSEKRKDSSTLIGMETTSEINYGSITKVSAFQEVQTTSRSCSSSRCPARVPAFYVGHHFILKAELKVFVRLTHRGQLRSEGRRFILTKTEE